MIVRSALDRVLATVLVLLLSPDLGLIALLVRWDNGFTRTSLMLEHVGYFASVPPCSYDHNDTHRLGGF